MLPLDYALALVLLTNPAETAEVTPPVEELVTVRPTLQAVALSWELMDQREVRYVLTRPEDFGADLKLLQRRYHDLHDAPPLDDCMRFPDRTLVNELLSFNRAYRQHLEGRQALGATSSWDLNEAVRETDQLYEVWDTVRDARCDSYYVTVRRQALKKLREAVGTEAYYSGTLPPHVPVWRFTRID
jgi:hypothetical protein